MRVPATSSTTVALLAALLLVAAPAANAIPTPNRGPGAGGTTVTVPVPGAGSFIQIAAGYYHSIALDADGNLWAWGWNFYGQVGNGAPNGNVTAPVQITTGTPYIAIGAGSDHSLALDADGNLWTWGSDNSGKLGNGAPTGDVTAPAQTTTGTTYTAIAAGVNHSIGLDADGNLWTWGYGGFGQLGNGNTNGGDVTAPAQVTTDTTFARVAASMFYSVALDADGNLWTWGPDDFGQVGNGPPTGIVAEPSRITTDTAFTHVVAGDPHSLALDADGGLWTWGSNSSGQVGNGAPTDDVTAPAQITTGTLRQIDVGRPPAITRQLADVTAEVGDSVTLTIAAESSRVPTAQWQQSTDRGATWTNLNGETGWNLTLTAADELDGTRYRALLTNDSGTSTSDAATLTVLPVVEATPTPAATPTPTHAATPTPSANETPADAPQPGLPGWLWAGVGFVFLLLVLAVLLLRRRRTP